MFLRVLMNAAKAIPGSELLLIEGMGHDLPRPLWPRLVEAIARHAHEADAAREADDAGRATPGPAAAERV